MQGVSICIERAKIMKKEEKLKEIVQVFYIAFESLGNHEKQQFIEKLLQNNYLSGYTAFDCLEKEKD